MLSSFKFWLYDFVPYSAESWRGLLDDYNQQYWPYSLVVIPVVSLIVWLGGNGNRQNQRVAMGLLAFCWLWSGLVFIRIHYASLNWVGVWLYWLFVFQAALLVVVALWGKQGPAKLGRQYLGTKFALVITSITILPLSQWIAGHHYTALSWFALTPDSTAVVTLAILSWIGIRHWILMAIPVIWCVLVFLNSWPLGLIPEMFLLPIAIFLTVFRNQFSTVRSPST